MVAGLTERHFSSCWPAEQPGELEPIDSFTVVRWWLCIHTCMHAYMHAAMLHVTAARAVPRALPADAPTLLQAVPISHSANTSAPPLLTPAIQYCKTGCGKGHEANSFSSVQHRA